MVGAGDQQGVPVPEEGDEHAGLALCSRPLPPCGQGSARASAWPGFRGPTLGEGRAGLPGAQGIGPFAVQASARADGEPQEGAEQHCVHLGGGGGHLHQCLPGGLPASPGSDPGHRVPSYLRKGDRRVHHPRPLPWGQPSPPSGGGGRGGGEGTMEARPTLVRMEAARPCVLRKLLMPCRQSWTGGSVMGPAGPPLPATLGPAEPTEASQRSDLFLLGYSPKSPGQVLQRGRTAPQEKGPKSGLQVVPLLSEGSSGPPADQDTIPTPAPRAGLRRACPAPASLRRRPVWCVCGPHPCHADGTRGLSLGGVNQPLRSRPSPAHWALPCPHPLPAGSPLGLKVLCQLHPSLGLCRVHPPVCLLEGRQEPKR